MRIEHLEIEHTVHADLDVIARDTDLLRNIDGSFFERMFVSHDVEKRNQNVKPGVERRRVFPQAFHDKRALLRDHARGFGHHDDDKHGQHQNDD